MTVSKAYSLLEKDGFVELVRGQGMRVAQRGPNGSLRQRQEQLLPIARQLAVEAHQLSLSRDHVRSLVDRALKELDGK